MLPPLDNDPDKDGKPSDHNIIVAKPISEINNSCARQIRKITVRPTPENKLQLLKTHFQCEEWQNLKDSNSAHEKAYIFHSHLNKKCGEIIPEKSRRMTSPGILRN